MYLMLWLFLIAFWQKPVMSKLYYGSGSCTISENHDVIGLEIRYRGAIRITDKTAENYNIVANNKKIIVFPTGIVEPLNILFEYTGNFKIVSALASDINGKGSYLTIKKAMDYPELMGKSEDLTEITSENMNAGYQYKGRVAKTTVDNKIIKNQHSKGTLYLEDGTAYSGAYHVHLETGKAMTGGEHSKASQDLYILRIKDNKLIKTDTVTKQVSRKTTTTRRRTSGTTPGGSGGGGY